MPITTLYAHYDGEKICLDEPFILKQNSRLIVTILSEYIKISDDNEYNTWGNISMQRLTEAYDDEEPEYPEDLVIEKNPDYERR
jgi:hypothetical protein